MDEYFCPNCDAVLNDQFGFEPDKGAWICTECGKALYDEDVESTMSRFKGVIWYCDGCESVLNKQLGFSDVYDTWTCAECGYENEISENNIDGINTNEMSLGESLVALAGAVVFGKIVNHFSPDSNEENGCDADDEDECVEDDDTTDNSSSNGIVSVEKKVDIKKHVDKKERKMQKEERRRILLSQIKNYTIAILLTLVVIMGLIIYFEIKGIIDLDNLYLCFNSFNHYIDINNFSQTLTIA